MNFCNPDITQKDEPLDWLFSALTFTGALSELLQENEGIVVEVKNDFLAIAREKYPDWKGTKLIVWKSATQVHIDICDDESMRNGQLLWVRK